MVKISIVVPVYNTSDYLEECLDSLLSQTVRDIEILCVNDGSTDRSLDILRDYERRYSGMISVINQENAGLSEARNAGIRQAQGTFIGFVDSDDYVAPEMFEKLYDKAVSGSFDMTVCDVTYVFPQKTIAVSSNIEQDIRTKSDLKQSMLRVYPTAWNKLYRRELFNKGVFFTKDIWYEDFEFLYRLYPHISSIGTIREPMYFYRQRPGAITGNYDKRLFQYVTNFESIIRYYKEHKLFEDYRNELEYLFVRYAYATMPKRLARVRDYAFYTDGVDFACKQVKLNFPEYKVNPLFKSQGAKGYYLLLFNGFIAWLVYLKENVIGSY